ncbi:MAG: hypothetical protein HY270_06100 [Deltaproteobacteria bacterium]|nr:hypothetical protein [Deltaproteobacteria bacterium]
MWIDNDHGWVAGVVDVLAVEVLDELRFAAARPADHVHAGGTLLRREGEALAVGGADE